VGEKGCARLKAGLTHCRMPGMARGRKARKSCDDKHQGQTPSSAPAGAAAVGQRAGAQGSPKGGGAQVGARQLAGMGVVVRLKLDHR
jgi:hypothetical protein